MFMLFKIAVSAGLIAGINAIARANPQLGGWIAALPVVSLLSIIWLATDGATGGDITAFITRVLYGLLPTAALLGIVAGVVGQGFSVAAALGCAAAAWLLLTVAARWLGILAV